MPSSTIQHQPAPSLPESVSNLEGPSEVSQISTGTAMSDTEDFLDTSDDEHSDISDDDDGVVPQKMYEKIMKAYQQIKKKNQILSARNVELQQRCSELEGNLKKNKKERDSMYRVIQNIHVSTLHVVGEQCEASTSDPAPLATCPSDVPTLLSQSHSDDKVHIGAGIFIKNSTWTWLKGAKTDSRFCKDLAVAVWGSEVLRTRSTEGRVCNRLKSTGAVAKPPLSPDKYMAIKDTFKKWLCDRGVPEPEVVVRHKKIGQYISEKIMDLNRKKETK